MLLLYLWMTRVLQSTSDSACVTAASHGENGGQTEHEVRDVVLSDLAEIVKQSFTSVFEATILRNLSSKLPLYLNNVELVEQFDNGTKKMFHFTVALHLYTPTGNQCYVQVETLTMSSLSAYTRAE